ncbi:hypothetical protein CERZMDRAFT_43063 [Cercospora zeae-maydis SCOH1-5]|uniref:HTH APSES-type domain-containing protein n=1 Tax=Cercospora zeae-maydis SCOH1-5 TaxID=717836 RepID=A0A6A6FDL1_9PEZI|nr:hypothetical protein CERZMDRAFT_43063 [Cercospora zeae-maydis SCOH1-5]
MAPDDKKIYSATYSNVPVYEFNVAGTHIMRRRSDDWINATHILKIADYDKPARTRILEREVQKGVHEKVQGGYGKYQGTWIPLQDGRELAQKNGVLDKLRPIFDFVPGDRSPPPAPKHATAASSKPRAPRAPPNSKRAPAKRVTESPMNPPTKRSAVHAGMHDYDQMSVQGSEAPDDVTVVSEGFDDYDPQYTGGGRKRRRVEEIMTQADKEHQLWADELLDYFMLMDSPLDQLPLAPSPPQGADLNRPIDDKGHTALHWAAAMGDLEVVKELIRKQAAVDVQSKSGETPLMRAVLFTNNYDRQNMDKLAGLLIRTVNMQEWYGQTVFHHIANITERKSKYQCARYYMDCILNKMPEIMSPDNIERILNTQDQNGDTAITIAARNGARKCVRSLIGRNAAVGIPNLVGETADSLIVQLNRRRQERNNHRQMSSSPFQPDTRGITFNGGPVRSHLNGMNGSMAIDPSLYKSEAALSLTSAIVPALKSKADQLAAHLESEIEEKEAERMEAERVAAERSAQIELLHRQLEELTAKELEQEGDGPDEDDALSHTLASLMQEYEALMREDEDAELKYILSEEEQAQSDSPADDMMLEDEEELVGQKLPLVQELYELVEKRKTLFTAIVQALSNAGMNNKQTEYRRLITGALGVREEDVEAMLPDIVAELEDWQGMNVGVS